MPTHYTNMQRAIDILKNPAFWMFIAAVVLINTFISPRNLDTLGGFFVSQGSSALLRDLCFLSWGSCTCMRAFFRKTHCRLLPAILDIFDCSDSRHVCCVDGPDFGTL